MHVQYHSVQSLATNWAPHTDPTHPHPELAKVRLIMHSNSLSLFLPHSSLYHQGTAISSPSWEGWLEYLILAIPAS